MKMLNFSVADIPALDALRNVVCEYNKEYSAFVLRFYFTENDYFYNEVWKPFCSFLPPLPNDVFWLKNYIYSNETIHFFLFNSKVLEKMYVVSTDLLEINMSTLIERTTTGERAILPYWSNCNCTLCEVCTIFVLVFTSKFETVTSQVFTAVPSINQDIEWKKSKNLCFVETKKKKICTKGRSKGQVGETEKRRT